MNSNRATYTLLACLLLSTIATIKLLDFNKAESTITFIGIVGSNASIIGIFYTLYQLSQIRKENALIKATSDETKHKLLSLQHYGDISSGISLIPEIQNYLRARKLEVAIVKIQELKRIIAEAASKTKDTQVNFAQDLQQLNLLISSFEKEIEDKRKSITISHVNGELEQIRDKLLTLYSTLKSTT